MIYKKINSIILWVWPQIPGGRGHNIFLISMVAVLLPKMQYVRRFSFGRCLVLLSVYMLGMVLGSAIMLSLDVSRVILEPVRTARDTIPGYSQVRFDSSSSVFVASL